MICWGGEVRSSVDVDAEKIMECSNSSKQFSLAHDSDFIRQFSGSKKVFLVWDEFTTQITTETPYTLFTDHLRPI
jgi:hypothetical protein